MTGIKVRHLLEDKGADLWTVHPDTTVFDALERLAEYNIGALLVLDGDKLVGIFSERDYARKIILKGKSSKGTPVKELMSTDVFYVDPEKTVEDCMAIMSNKRIRHLPVFKEEQLCGIITIGDVVNRIIKEQSFALDEMEKYISGRRYGV